MDIENFKIPINKINHHHSSDCQKCNKEVELQFIEIDACKIKLDQKFEAINLALEDMDLFSE